MEILVDSNVILDVLTSDSRWFAWSSRSLASYANAHVLAINPIIYAEVSIGFKRIEEVEAVLPPAYFRACRSRGRRRFWPGNAFCGMPGAEGENGGRFLTSLSAPTPL
jgi:hypothetical protein